MLTEISKWINQHNRKLQALSKQIITSSTWATDKRKCIVNYMVRNSYSTVSKWHQSTDFVWYDLSIRTEMVALTLLLRLDFRRDCNHHHKKGMKAPSTLWWWYHPLYKKPHEKHEIGMRVQSHSKELYPSLFSFDLSFGWAYLDHPEHFFVQGRSPSNFRKARQTHTLLTLHQQFSRNYICDFSWKYFFKSPENTWIYINTAIHNWFSKSTFIQIYFWN